MTVKVPKKYWRKPTPQPQSQPRPLVLVKADGSRKEIQPNGQ